MELEKMIVLILYNVVVFFDNRVRRVCGGEINKLPIISNGIA